MGRGKEKPCFSQFRGYNSRGSGANELEAGLLRGRRRGGSGVPLKRATLERVSNAGRAHILLCGSCSVFSRFFLPPAKRFFGGGSSPCRMKRASSTPANRFTSRTQTFSASRKNCSQVISVPHRWAFPFSTLSFAIWPSTTRLLKPTASLPPIIWARRFVKF